MGQTCPTDVVMKLPLFKRLAAYVSNRKLRVFSGSLPLVTSCGRIPGTNMGD